MKAAVIISLLVLVVGCGTIAELQDASDCAETIRERDETIGGLANRIRKLEDSLLHQTERPRNDRQGLSGCEEDIRKIKDSISKLEERIKSMQDQLLHKPESAVNKRKDQPGYEEEIRKLKDATDKLAERIRSFENNLHKDKKANAALEDMLKKREAIQGNSPRAAEILDPEDGFLRKYQQARGLFDAKRYNDSYKLFVDLGRRTPDNSYTDNCEYWAGECLYATGAYSKAIRHFELARDLPFSNKVADSDVMLGNCYYRLSQYGNAIKHFQAAQSALEEKDGKLLYVRRMLEICRKRELSK